MKKIIFLVSIFLFFFNLSFANFKVSLKEYLDNKSIDEASAQIYLLNRCSAVYTYASAILLETDKLNSKNFIEISNNLLFKSIELMIIDEQKKLETAQEEAEKIRKEMFPKDFPRIINDRACDSSSKKNRI